MGQDKFQDALKAMGIRSVQGYLGNLVRAWFSPAAIDRVGLDELVQGGLTALWRAAAFGKVGLHEPKFRAYCLTAARYEMARKIKKTYRRGLKGAPTEHVPEFSQAEDAQLSDEPSEPRSLWAERNLQIIEAVLLDNPREGQGERDLAVFKAWLAGNKTKEIAELCHWLNGHDSAYQALIRIIRKIREFYGINPELPVPIYSDSPQKRVQGSRFRTDRYSAAYYKKNQERLQKKYRDKKRARRGLPQWVLNLSPGAKLNNKNLLELEEEILLQHPYPEEGERDVELFAAWFCGGTLVQIQAECPWLGAAAQTREAIIRVVQKIRSHYGLDPLAPIQVGAGDQAEMIGIATTTTAKNRAAKPPRTDQVAPNLSTLPLNCCAA